jgi:hypothetical protein
VTFLTGRLTTKLHQLALEYQQSDRGRVSMMDAAQLEYIYQAAETGEWV